MLQLVRAGQARVEPVWGPLLDIKGAPLCQGEFLVKPTNATDRRRWQKEHKMCSKCNGVGVLPFGDGAPKCPFCHGRPELPSMDKPEIQTALAGELCLGWRGVPSDEGGELEFTSQALEENVIAFPIFFWAILTRSGELGEGQAAAQGKA